MRYKLESPVKLSFKRWAAKSFAEDDRLKHLFDAEGLIFFFKKGDDYFGAGEDSRMAFARMKTPDDETPDGWEEEASFSAENLAKLIRGEPATHVFSHADLKKIKVVDEDKAAAALSELKPTAATAPLRRFVRIVRVAFNPDSSDKVPNFSLADEN
jgi:hypothetical protein